MVYCRYINVTAYYLSDMWELPESSSHIFFLNKVEQCSFLHFRINR